MESPVGEMTNDLKGPSVPHVLLCFGFFLLNIVSFQVQILPNFDGYTDKNFYGFLFGGFIGVIALARFEYVDALRVRSRKSFEWTLISAKKLVRSFTLLGWLFSVWHAISWVRELTRLWS
tara:strand:- start:2 stop:361 length:360 start_codon:yes stop_codon:yes gene_type:complete